jgi:hypothetical protein
MSHLNFKTDLEKSIQDVASQVKSLCDYLQELRVSKSLLDKYSKQHIAKNINKVVQKIPYFPVMRPLACGITKNNIDQFTWMDQQLNRYNPGQSLANINLPPWSNINRSLSIDNKINNITCQVIFDFLSDTSLSPYLKDFLFNFSLHFTRFYIAFSNFNKKSCPFICVANDHYPVQMGFAKAAKSHRIFRIYLQHAFVTDLFPEIDFDLSVLFNRKSAEIYGVLPELGKSVLVIPRYPVIFDGKNEKLYKKENQFKKNVVIYLGGSNCIEIIRMAIDLLQANSSVDKVAVKLHPNPVNHSIKDELIALYGSKIIALNDIDFPHTAICGNSSVVMKLLALGVRCYHLFDLDTRRRDYYGFAASGAAKELSISNLAEKFWVDWNEDQYNAIRSTYIEDPFSACAERHLIALDNVLSEKTKNIQKLIYFQKAGPDASSKSSSNPDHEFFLTADEAYYLNTLLMSFSSDSLFVHNKEGLDRIGSKKKIDILTRAYRFRHPRAIDIMLSASKHDASNWVRIYFKYHSAFLVGVKLLDNFEDDIKHVYSSACELQNPEILISRILTYLSAIEPNKVVFALKELRKYPVKYGKIDSKTWSRVTFSCNDEQRSEFLKNHRYHSVLRELKMPILKLTNHASHDEFVDAYLSSKSGDAVQYLASIFDSIEKFICTNKVADLRLARVDESAIDRFWNLLKSSIISSKGFALIRLGDGEGYIYSSEIFLDCDCKNRERHWWGYELHDAHRLRIQQQLRTAVMSSDVIGLPSIFRFMRDLSAISIASSDIYKTVQRRGLFEVLDGYIKCGARPSAVVEDRANDFLFSSLLDRLKGLTGYFNKVVLISSLPDEVSNAVFAEFSNFVPIQIPTRARTFRQRGRALHNNLTLPCVYNEIIDLVRHNSRPGVVLLVAAGVIGKLFIHVGKQCGAVALDIGEVAECLGKTEGFKLQ